MAIRRGSTQTERSYNEKFTGYRSVEGNGDGVARCASQRDFIKMVRDGGTQVIREQSARLRQICGAMQAYVGSGQSRQAVALRQRTQFWRKCTCLHDGHR